MSTGERKKREREKRRVIKEKIEIRGLLPTKYVRQPHHLATVTNILFCVGGIRSVKHSKDNAS